MEADKEISVKDESGDDALMLSEPKVHARTDAATSDPRVLVKLEDGKRGDTLFLEGGHRITPIPSSWSWDADVSIGASSLQSNGLLRWMDLR